MERHHYGFNLIFSVIIILALGLISFTFCVAAEFKRSKKEDLRLDGNLCFLPGSQAFGLGIAALICFFIAQVTGNFIICRKFCSRGQISICKAQKPTIASISLSLSWISFVVVVILIGAATSMSQTQPLGEGWLDGECYIVKDGVYFGSGILILITISSMFIWGIITMRKSQVEPAQKFHAQVE